ncbi:hypothetical protein I3F58_13260 [Streptomyces sp. MUM 203J]|uniref:DUF6571 family protein n=1 Tax=Streptomyces sp. MUM 203J TaxID=2791990 RepID=UPI001F038B89|nr:DUF6571 family protein [Streptomyces sp. MUM 203J]MCH0540523.1 hypothetical protein [Streptomyces sp. MUM 203J]
MGLTYKKIMETDFGKLTAAAKAWDDMAAEFKKAGSIHAATTRGLKGTLWNGISHLQAQQYFQGTQYEYAAAEKQAKATADLIRDAHHQFTELKKLLKSLVADAVKDKMTVDAEGNVRPNLSASERSAYIHDPDGQKYLTQFNKAADSWAAQIKKYVKAFEDTDADAKMSLEAVVVDGKVGGNDQTTNGFNADAQGDIEIYEARNSAEIGTRIANGEKVSDAEYAQFKRSMQENVGNQQFNHTLLNNLGAEGTIRVANQLNDLTHSSENNRQALYRDTNHALSNVLAAATKVPEFKGANGEKITYGTREYAKAFKTWSNSDKADFYNGFLTDLKKAGAAQYGLDVATNKLDTALGQDQKIRGYQGLVTLMQQGEGYSPQFLGDLADQMIEAEREHKNIWDLHGKFEGEHGGWFANDPVDGTLKIMSENPEAATGYLDPAADGGNDRLKYLLREDERDWDVVNTSEWHGNHQVTRSAEDADSRKGLAAALEAGTTGYPPLKADKDPWPETPHTEAQARLMRHLIGELAPSSDEGTEAKVHANIRQPVARALASFTADTHQILSGTNVDYVASGLDAGHFTEGGNGHLAAPSKDLVQVMRGLAEDPKAYASLHKAESRYIELELERIPQGAPNVEDSTPLSKAGNALGVYSAIREDIINDERMDKYTKADWQTKMAYHVAGGAVAPISITTAGGSTFVVGELAQRGVDTWAWDLGNKLKSDADAEANAAIAKTYFDAETQMALTIGGWADGRPDIDTTTESGKDLQGKIVRAILSSHHEGSDRANKFLTDTSN